MSTEERESDVIAVSSSGKSFQALAAYLSRGRSGQELDRVAWSSGRNLATDDPELAAKFMRATASRSDRVEKPVYHLVLSFDPKDRIDRPAMERVADRVLDRLGLAEHQAAIVAHRDREHSHVHVFVNRVHPETGKAWERWKDQPVVQEVLREEEAALGLKRVRGTLAVQREPQEAAVSPDGRVRAGTPEHEARTERAPRSRLDQIKRDLLTYETVVSLSREHYGAKRVVDAARARLTQIDEAAERARSADATFLGALRGVYRDPVNAKQAWDRYAQDKGVVAATSLLRDEPERFGELRTVEKKGIVGLWRRHDDREARNNAKAAARFASVAIAAEHGAAAAVRQARTRRLDEEFGRHLHELFANPTVARHRFNELVASRGAEQASRTLAERPTEIGNVRSTIAADHERFGGLTRATARKGLEAANARREASLASEWPRGGSQWAKSFEVEKEATRAGLERAGSRARTLNDELKRHPRRSELRERIVQATDMLLPHDVRRLKTALTAPHLALAASMRSTAREVLLGPDDERSR